jgi:hypothetical protein
MEPAFYLCYSLVLRDKSVSCVGTLSGRSAAWLARLVRDQEVEGSNPFAPTNFLKHFHAISGFSSTALWAFL